MKFSNIIWADTIENYLRDKEESWYKKPEDVIPVLVNPLNGKIATSSSKKRKIIYYLKGTQPTEYDN